MNVSPNIPRLSKLDVSGFKIGETVLFCSSCDWQAFRIQVQVNECPRCGEHGLSLSRIDQELIDLTADK